jgi:S-formylglutathione hydrolase FrmB
LTFPSATCAQTNAVTAATSKQTAAVKTLRLDSKLMAREMPYNIIVPPAYDSEKQTRFPVLYLLHGLYGSHKDWTSRTKIAEYAVRHRIIIVNPEGANGWYSDSATMPNDRYETYIIEELVPEIDKNYRTISKRSGRAVAGLSMGGFGALKFGVKYPEMFALAASMSGAVAVSSYRTDADVGKFAPLLKPVFGEPGSATQNANNLFKIVGEMPAEKIAALPFLYLDCGTEDELGLLSSNQRLAAALIQRKIPHEFRQLPGKHNWAFWNQQIVEILQLSDKIFAAPAAMSKQ